VNASRGVVAQLAKFAGAMREHGIRVGLGDEIDAATALTLLDLLDRHEVRRGLRIALKVPRDAWATFDRLFDQYWGGSVGPRRPLPLHGLPRDHRGPLQWQWDGQRVRLSAADDAGPRSGDDTPGYTSETLLRRKPFEQFSAADVAAMERLLARLAIRLATRRSRRLIPTHGRGLVDLRRSFRHALGSEGELFRLAHRTRALEEPRLVVLYDTSGSMDSYARFLLAFAFALRRALKRTEIFAFNTALVRITRLIAPAKTAQTFKQLAAGVPDWSGGTRIGACLAEFISRYQNELVDRNTTVVLISDGLDLGDAAQLARAMRELRARAGTIVWLNPLLGDPRYQPTAAGMQAALPFVDYFGPAHNLESLEKLLRYVK
jgi:uncharacterized protein with von Willebrand factor type A (vWA) domain